MDGFQARDIQRILGIPKHRYEYIASKVGIKPDIEEVEGTGRTNKYSLKNVLQFAFVDHANLQRMSPAACRDMLKLLDKVDSAKRPIYSDRFLSRFSLYFMTYRREQYFAIGGDEHVNGTYKLPDGSLKKGKVPQSFLRVYRRGTPPTKKMKLVGVNDLDEPGPRPSRVEGGPVFSKFIPDEVFHTIEDHWLVFCESYLALNLGIIKARVWEKLRE